MRRPDEPTSVTLDLPVALAIPTDYIGDVNLRMEIYRKLGSGRPEPDELLVELRDRFRTRRRRMCGACWRLAALKATAEAPAGPVDLRAWRAPPDPTAA